MTTTYFCHRCGITLDPRNGPNDPDCTKHAERAVAEILALRGRVARLEEALRPFVYCVAFNEYAADTHGVFVQPERDCRRSDLTVGDFRRAAAALTEGKEPTSFSVAPGSEHAPVMDRPEAAPAKCSTCRDSGWWQNPKYADNPQAGLELCPACTKPADAGRS